MKKKSMLVLFVVVLGLSMSCNLLSATDDSDPVNQSENQESDFPTDELKDSGMSFGENAQWPEYIPDDIPVLEGDIRIVMGTPGDPRVRIFYEPLTEKQIEQYLEQCEKAGFELDYVVYVQEGFPDRSDEKMKAGDFDAVEITKGNYRMRLEYGSDTVTLDIELP
jgi:hypothetical protein